jgi:hypothetical protein
MLRTAVETLAAVKGTEAFATRWAMTRLGETGAADARLGEAADHGH